MWTIVFSSSDTSRLSPKFNTHCISITTGKKCYEICCNFHKYISFRRSFSCTCCCCRSQKRRNFYIIEFEIFFFFHHYTTRTCNSHLPYSNPAERRAANDELYWVKVCAVYMSFIIIQRAIMRKTLFNKSWSSWLRQNWLFSHSISAACLLVSRKKKCQFNWSLLPIVMLRAYCEIYVNSPPYRASVLKNRI